MILSIEIEFSAEVRTTVPIDDLITGGRIGTRYWEGTDWIALLIHMFPKFFMAQYRVAKSIGRRLPEPPSTFQTTSLQTTLQANRESVLSLPFLRAMQIIRRSFIRAVTESGNLLTEETRGTRYQ